MVHKVDGFPGREIHINGEVFLYFGGTAYLGLQTSRDFQKILIRNIKRFGTNYSASRRANVQLSIYDEAEAYLARLLGCKSCFTLSSGYLAGQLISRHFHQKGHRCFFAPDTHGAVHTLHSKNHENLASLIFDLNKAIDSEEKSPVLFMESVMPNGRNYPDFEWLGQLPLKKMILVVDDSHGLGIVGKNGGGVLESLKKLKTKELILCGSLGKGFGIQAGIIAGSSNCIDELMSTDMFAAASPASPSSLATLMQSSKILARKRALLMDNIDYFLTKLEGIGTLAYMPDYPSFAFDDVGLGSHLFNDKIVVTNFNYPTEYGRLVQRIVITAAHSRKDLERLAKSLVLYG